MKIMLADDDEGMRALVEHIVTDEGYEIVCAEDGRSALTLFDEEHPDLVILDVMMPRLDGFEVCDELRRRGADVPIIMLTARGDIFDKSMGFKMGADDYLVKPFIGKELILRIEALMRRASSRAKGADAPPALRFDGLEIDVGTHTVLVRGEPVELANKEFQLLAMLASEPGYVFTHERILREIWGEDMIGGTSGVTVLVYRLRNKIEEDPTAPKFIQTVRRTGYRFALPPE